MTTLNKLQTAMLRAFIDGGDNIEYFFVNDSRLSSAYSSIKADLASWETDYGNQNLSGTNPNNTTFQFSGIDHFPHLP